MDPRTLLDRLQSAGIRLDLVNGQLRATSPAGPPPDDLRDAIREHKAALLAALAAAADLGALVESIGTRMQTLREVPAGEWEAQKRALLADHDRLDLALALTGTSLEDWGWTCSGPGCHWRRLDAEGGKQG